MNPYADLARQKKATTLALLMSRPYNGLSPAARKEALSTLAEAVEILVRFDSRAEDPTLYRLFDDYEAVAEVPRSSLKTWAIVADILRAMAEAADDDPFEDL